jgi:hypothetical protein
VSSSSALLSLSSLSLTTSFCASHGHTRAHTASKLRSSRRRACEQANLGGLGPAAAVAR